MEDGNFTNQKSWFVGYQNGQQTTRGESTTPLVAAFSQEARTRLMIEIRDVRKQFILGGKPLVALDGVNLQVEAGEIYGVVGPSGAGKSTLIRCVNMLETPTSGTIQVNGQEMTTLQATELRRARQRIGMIFQHFNLLSARTVAGNIAFPLEISGYNRRDCNKRVNELLDLVDLQDKANAYPAQLSGGQKQRVGIARALANEPDVLLSDEATSALDPQNTEAILNLLRDLNRRLGLTILLITHEMNVVKQICDRVAFLEDGKIVEHGSVSDLVSRPASRLARALFPRGEVQKTCADAVGATISFIGEMADKPVLTSLVRKFNIEVNIIGGNIQNAGGRRVGQLQVELTGDQVQQALAHLNSLGLNVEVF